MAHYPPDGHNSYDTAYNNGDSTKGDAPFNTSNSFEFSNKFNSWDDVPLENLIQSSSTKSEYEDVEESEKHGDQPEIKTMKREIKQLKLELNSLQTSFAILEKEKQDADDKIIRLDYELDRLYEKNHRLECELLEEKELNRSDEYKNGLLNKINALEKKLANANLNSESWSSHYDKSSLYQNMSDNNDDANMKDKVFDMENQINDLKESVALLEIQLKHNEKIFKEKESKYIEEIENLNLKNNQLESLPPLSRSFSSALRDKKVQNYDFEMQCEHLESVISTLEIELQEKSLAASNALKQLQQIQEEEESKRLKHLEELEAVNTSKDELQSQVESLSKERNGLTSLINQAEIKDWNRPGHILKLKRVPNFVCTVCRRTGSGWGWKCTTPICKDCTHISCAKA